MGWMAEKEHSSGPVIQTHSPIFWGDSFYCQRWARGLSQMGGKDFSVVMWHMLGNLPLLNGRQPGVRLHMLGNSHQSPLKPFPPLSEAWTHQTPLPRLSPYKSRLRHEPSHSLPLLSP
ncbi:hypothetical protein NPIL_143131 [Nephila pilipes]|uniref:Uncharacterized protein n=1 Tax=Nephila pilipes TaxID=299642 RepID=A0A8X6P4E6_NEPPI|nr:hypothetical protein NPIL_143131 [Nephila pilipes]